MLGEAFAQVAHLTAGAVRVLDHSCFLFFARGEFLE